MRQLTLATPEPVAAGSIFRGDYQGLGVLMTTLTEYDRPRRLTFSSDGPRARLDGVFTVDPASDGAEVTLSAEVRPRGVLAFLVPLIEPAFQRQNSAAAARLKAALENPDRSTK